MAGSRAESVLWGGCCDRTWLVVGRSLSREVGVVIGVVLHNITRWQESSRSISSPGSYRVIGKCAQRIRAPFTVMLFKDMHETWTWPFLLWIITVWLMKPNDTQHKVRTWQSIWLKDLSSHRKSNQGTKGIFRFIHIDKIWSLTINQSDLKTCASSL